MNLTFKSQIVTDVPLSWLSRYGTDTIASRNFSQKMISKECQSEHGYLKSLTLAFRVENG